MIRPKTVASIIGVGLWLAGCSFASDKLWPSISDEAPSPKVEPQQPRAAGAAEQNLPVSPPAGIAPAAGPTQTAAATAQVTTSAPPPPPLGSSNFVPPAVTPGVPTGTFVGQKISILRIELQQLQNRVRQQNQHLQAIRNQTVNHSRDYHGTIAAINARLQVGTTPGNPTLIAPWNSAQALLAGIDNDIAQLNGLANDVAGTSTLSAYLLETTRATYGLTGAVDEDHRQLAVLQDEVHRTVVLIDRLLSELSNDVSRQTSYLSNERSNLTTLSLAIKNGEAFGGSLANRAFSSPAFASAGPVFGSAPPPRPAPQIASTAVPPPALAPAAASRPAPRRPLVVIRFDRPNVEYEQPLYTALSRALERRPDATFDLVAIAPNRGTAAEVTVASNTSKRHAESVLRSISEMGMPLDRIRLSATTSGQAATNEVHIYVR